ncbi:integral membrane protein [Ophiocordyceps camponoti-floridani]|uniref:Integral membrane protein n=1 Tax=Ophiocordyceps camponoti-floridani TaxID=2030778 RepID=A0A8H4Q8K0_9HYPO|nr:integral membrane protein [Ophiocordyceps camponoti-floridani]
MAQAPITTIPPFADTAKLPDCARACGPLYDANGACVPPAAPQSDPAAYTACFCSHAKVAPFSKGTAGVCDAACTANQAGLQSIAGWFQSICKSPSQPPPPNNNNNNNNGNVRQNNNGAGGSSPVSPVVPANNGGGDWLSHHWQWVIMLVILVVGIAGIWIGACVWRRRYLRNKDQLLLNQKHQPESAAAAAVPAAAATTGTPSWGPVIPPSESHAPMTFLADSERSFTAEKAGSPKDKLKWTVTERT